MARKTLVDPVPIDAPEKTRQFSIPETKSAAKGKPAKPTGGAKVVTISPPTMTTGEFLIKGTTPLCVHQWSIKALRKMLGGRFGLKFEEEKEDKNPEDEYNASRYISTKGWDGFPAGAFRSACVGACRVLEKPSMALAKTLFSVIPDGQSVPIEIPELGLKFQPQSLIRIIGEPKMRTDMIRVDNGNPDIRFRAEYWPWSAVLRIRFNASVLSFNDMSNLVYLGGTHQGVGEMRPSAPKSDTGDSGRWELVTK